VLYDDERPMFAGLPPAIWDVIKTVSPTDAFEPGMELLGKQTIFAEGCRGHLTKTLFDKYDLREGKDPANLCLSVSKNYGISTPAKSEPGKVWHSVGWPVSSDVYGGSFLYHLNGNQVAVGYVIGLDYKNPHLSPFDEFQRFKMHPKVKDVFEGGRRVSYGARALNEGGFQSIPKLTFPGGCLVGCTAGFLNVPKIKGTHTSMKSGMLAADAVFDAIADDAAGVEPVSYGEKIEGILALDRIASGAEYSPRFQSWIMVGHGICLALIPISCVDGRHGHSNITAIMIS
jgi:electron-transferring-flavoprotein dehydrogenase